MMETYDVAIIGAGPGGLTAGLYCGRARLGTLILEEKVPGGELLNTARIEDYPGFEEVSGQELAERMEGQARKFRVEIRQESVLEVTSEGKWKKVTTEERTYQAGAVIVAAGGKPRKLDVPGEAELAGRGVSYCALCDGPFFQDQVIAVVGGGNTAVEEADYLTKFGKKVFIIHRRGEFRAQPIIQERALNNAKIEVLWNTVVTEIKGDREVRAVQVKNVEGLEDWELAVQGVFIFIGFTPNNIKKDHAKHDQAGFFLTNEKMETSVPGIYAVGDIRAQPVRQITNAVADGTVAAVMAQKYLEEHQLVSRK
ncbi:MAG: thioredoxin-disulfide reductase [Candidatus Methylomirabilales bacterium]